MAKIEITVPGERIVEDFTALVPQPTSPSTARAPDVGLVELSYVNPTDLIPGPPGPPGPAGTRWYTGVGDPTITGAKLGDYYLDDVTGYIWTWNGTAWVMTGTDLSPDASELLLKIKTVDGSGSGLDADTLDGQDGSYYLDWDNFTDKPTTFPPTLPIAQSDVTNLVSDLALKAPLASPTFTGDPKAPTPAAADNDTSIATTAFVKSVVGTVNPFPEAPIDGLTYGRKNAAWSTIVGGAVVSDTAPGGPLQTGQLWYESDSGNTYIWYDDPSADTGQWVQQNVLPADLTSPPQFIRQQFITVSGAITLHAETKAYMVEVQGGGGGGGSATTGTASNAQPCPGGGAGGYCSKWIVRPSGVYNLTGTVGAAGAAAGNGGTSSFSDGIGSALNANGGVGGSTAYNATAGARMGSPGGTAAGGDINVTGDHGGYSYHASAAGYVTAMVQPGAASRFGAGGAGQVLVTSTAYHNGGNAASGYGAGGAGAINAFAGAAVPGGAGSPGCIVITEFR